MTVRVCECGELVYELRAARDVVVLDTVDHPAGRWMPEPDGRSVQPVDSGGHREHVCDRLPEGQDALFGPTPP